MAIPTLKVEVGFGSTWKTPDASIVWVDLTSRVMDRAEKLDVMRGATAAHGRAGAGTIGLTFKNADRYLDPLYDAGPYYGQLLPGVPIRITATAVDDLLLDGEGRPILDPSGDYLTVESEGILDEAGDPILDESGAAIGGDTVTISVARGFVTSWPQKSTRGDTMTTVPVRCIDGFQNLARASTPRSVLSETLTALGPQNYWPLSDPSGSRRAVDVVGNNHGTTIDEPTFGADQIRTGLKTSAMFDGVNDRIDVSRSPLVEDLYHMSIVAVIHTTERAASAAEIHPIFAQSDGNGPGLNDALTMYVDHNGKACIDYYVAGIGYSFESADEVDDGQPHLIIAQSNVGFGFDYGVAVDSATLNTTAHAAVYNSGNGAAIGGTPNAARGYEDNAYAGRISDVAAFSAPLTSAQRQSLVDAFNAWDGDTTGERLERELDHVGWPDDLRDIDTGRSILGPAEFDDDDNALSYSQLIERTEDGRMFVDSNGRLAFRDRYWPFDGSTSGGTSQVTFTDEADGIGFAEFDWDYDAELVINSPRYSRRGGGEIHLEDAASRDLYGTREDVQSDLLLGTDAEVKGRAHWTLMTRKDAKPRVRRISIPLHAYRSSLQLLVLGLELGDRVTCRRTPQGIGDAIEREFHVDGIRHQIGAAEWWVELYVSPAVDQDLTLFKLGTSTLGGSHVLAH